jgi:hypothetical protein
MKEALLVREAVLGGAIVFVACMVVLYAIDQYIHRSPRKAR